MEWIGPRRRAGQVRQPPAACHLLLQFIESLPGIQRSGANNSVDPMQVSDTSYRVGVEQHQVCILACVNGAHG